jgi:predicted RNA-binding protein YlqC (UPF0109 family)
MEKYQKLLEDILNVIVDYPEEIKITRKTDEMGVLLNVKISPKDMGAVIGKRGNTIMAIRTLVKIAGIKSQARVNIKLEEPEERSKGLEIPEI